MWKTKKNETKYIKNSILKIYLNYTFLADLYLYSYYIITSTTHNIDTSLKVQHWRYTLLCSKPSDRYNKIIFSIYLTWYKFIFKPFYLSQRIKYILEFSFLNDVDKCLLTAWRVYKFLIRNPIHYTDSSIHTTHYTHTHTYNPILYFFICSQCNIHLYIILSPVIGKQAKFFIKMKMEKQILNKKKDAKYIS